MIAVLTAMLCLPLAGAASATGWSSEWVEIMHARVRLVAGPVDRPDRAERLIGVQIDLDPGWHTYWRNPGASGVPPRFDWSRSRNLQAARVRWPAPRTITETSGTSLGYQGQVVFPVRIRAADPGQPVEIALEVTYAVCADICIPAYADLALVLIEDTAPPRDIAALLAAHDARVPVLQAEGDNASRPRVLRAWPEAVGDTVNMVVEAAIAGKTHLYLEGPRDLYFAVPKPATAPGAGRVRFTVPVRGARHMGELSGRDLRATLVGETASIEHSWTVE